MKTLPLSMLLLAIGVGCGGQETAPPPGPPPATTAGAVSPTAVAKITFVGQQEACPCTRKRVDETWKTLQGVLARGPKIPVERIQLDVDEQRYDELDDRESLVVAPGIYFFDVDDKILKLLQGESSAAQIESVLRK